jgi:hypothetical protein
MGRSTFALAVLASSLALAVQGFAAQVCSLTDSSTKEVIPGVILTWDSSFHCLNAPESDEYMITVRVSNAASSLEAVTIETIQLKHTTPRPRGRGPAATAEADGLPFTVGPGENDGFFVRGTYELVETDEGMKANLHLRAHGVGVESGELFKLGINVHIRGAGSEEEEEETDGPRFGPPF